MDDEVLAVAEELGPTPGGPSLLVQGGWVPGGFTPIWLDRHRAVIVRDAAMMSDFT